MKVIPIALAANLNGQAATPAYALRVTRQDGQVFGFTSAGRPATISGVTYSATQGLDASAIATSAGLNVDNLELTTLDDGSLFTKADLRAGVWQGAAFLVFRYSWASPADGIEPIIAGTFGNVTPGAGAVRIELRGLQQYLQQPVGSITTKTCRARFADAPTPNGDNRCTLVAAAWTERHTVVSVSSRRAVTSSRVSGTRPDDWFADGIVTWVTGANAGQMIKVKAFTSSGNAFVLMTDMAHDIEVGDTFDALAGCRRRLDEDCATKFGNELNFQAEPHLPGLDALTASPASAG